MAKFLVGILLFAAAVFWSSASARPYNSEQQRVIDAFTRWAITEMKELPEPHKTRMTNQLREAQHQHSDNLMEYMAYVQSMLIKYVQESGIEFSRRKRHVDSDSDESVETDRDEFVKHYAVYTVYTRILIVLSPSEYKSTLEQKYEELLGTSYVYDNIDEFHIAADHIFEEVTGLGLDKIFAEYEENDEKLSELEQQLEADLLKLFDIKELPN